MEDYVFDMISERIADFFEDCNCEDVSIEYADQFYYDYDNDVIGYTYNADDSDRDFVTFFERELNGLSLNCFLYSLFHEYGHKMTIDDFTTDKREKYHSTVSALTSSNLDDAAVNESYFNLDIELAATNWARNFIKKHYNKIAIWYNTMIFPLLLKVLEETTMYDWRFAIIK